MAAVGTLVFAAILLRTAWISDDALITLRTVLNVTHGFGLRFNIAERVQTYTHPLWMLLLTAGYAIVGNVYVTTFAASITCSLIVFWAAVTGARSPLQAVLAAVVLMFSEAFVDFATSGLENPLLDVLLLVFIGVFLHEKLDRPARRLTWLCTLTSLIYLTRPDAILLVLPLLALVAWQTREVRAIAVAAVMGSLPALAWTLFALLYYGFPFPNTAYAKLAMGIDHSELRAQGILYLLDSLDRDPISLTAIALGAAVAVFQRTAPARALAGGIFIYLIYVVSIGGDFMTGRFIAVPVYAAVLLIARCLTAPRAVWGTALVVLAIMGTTAAHITLWSNSHYGDAAPKPSGIVDERAVYFHDRSLVLAKRGTFREPDWPRAHGGTGHITVVNTCGLMGAAGIDFGPYIHLLDECALADPLLARLPAVFNPEWRTGHYRRMIPAGYSESLAASDNELQDSALRAYYDHLRLITRSNVLWSAERLRTIAAMNTGRYDRLIDRDYYRHAGSIATLDQLASIRANGTPGNADGNHSLKIPLAIPCPPRAGRRYLDVSLDADDRYLLTFLKNGEILSTLELGPIPTYRRQPGLTNYTADIPARARERGFDTIVVAGVAGDDHYALGHLIVEGTAATDWELYRRVSLRDGLTADSRAVR
jgi:arabinofuranosyltransferase